MAKVAMVKRRMFLVRFQTMDARDQVLAGNFFFDKKPLILKPWTSEIDFEKEDIKTVPVWVQLKLSLKYWGQKLLHKIASQIGDPIKRDDATRNQDKLQYARILLEVNMDQKLPEFVQFWNEKGELTEVFVMFKWKPVQCMHCKGF